MPLKTKQQKKEKLKEIELKNLINKVSKFSVFKDKEKIKNIITINQEDKRISITNYNYDLLSFEQKKDIFRLKNEFSFYVQWKFFHL